jgi:hypothetical protein
LLGLEPEVSNAFFMDAPLVERLWCGTAEVGFAPTASRIARRQAPWSFLTRLLDAELTSLLMLLRVYRENQFLTTVRKSLERTLERRDAEE